MIIYYFFNIFYPLLLRFIVDCDRIQTGRWGILIVISEDGSKLSESFRYDEDDLVAIIQTVISENIGLKNVGRDAIFSRDLKMDEPTRIEILLAIEHAIGFKVSNEALNSVDSISDALFLYRTLLDDSIKSRQKSTPLTPFSNYKSK